ncbi:MAG: DegT/DnrJ/EryC1/StrS family aminotransferase [Chloroflexi bacterium]|nr:DegT/DnrJ/EryC1/StrS family aminotransferase [Chloroflexota bacterium]
MSVATPKRYLLAQRTIDEQDIAELVSWLQTNPWLTQGPLVKQFEQEWSSWLGRKHSVFVNSGSSANLLMYYALLVSGRLPNRKVVVPAISWATTVAPAIQLGFEPVMCEADWETFGLDMAELDQLCQREQPGAVIMVQTLGVPGHMDRLLELQRKHGFALMEDACPATGSTFQGRKVGSFGDMSSFSFYFGHHLSTIEGGMVSTDDDEMYDILLHIRSHGWAKDLDPEKERELATSRGVLEFNRPFTFYHPGFNVRSTDLNAHIGLSQLRKADHVVRRRIENQQVYERRFKEAKAFHFPRNERGVTCSISFVALAASNGHRERVGEALKANNIETRPLGGGSMSRQPFWADRYGSRAYPVADAIHERSFMLPNNPDLTVEDINFICDVTLAVKDS